MQNDQCHTSPILDLSTIRVSDPITATDLKRVLEVILASQSYEEREKAFYKDAPILPVREKLILRKSTQQKIKFNE